MKKVVILLLAISLILGCTNAVAATLEDVKICVDAKYSETYSSRGEYIGKVKIDDSSIVDAKVTGTSLTISNRISYGTIITFTGLKAGKTNVTFYSESGSRMGSVKVIVSNHSFAADSPRYSSAVTDSGEIVYIVSAISKCTACDAIKSDDIVLSDKQIENYTPLVHGTYVRDDESDEILALNRVLIEKGYSTKSDNLIRVYNTYTRVGLSKLQQNLGLETSERVTPELLDILFCDFVPADNSKYTPSTNTHYTPLTMEQSDKNVLSFQQILNKMNYLPDDCVSGKFDENTRIAVMMFQIHNGMYDVNGFPSAELCAALNVADISKLTIDDTVYTELYNQVTGLLNQANEAFLNMKPAYVIKITTACNIRDQASYNGKALSWVKEGETFDYVGEESGWYIIQLSDGTTAYAPMERSQKIDN